MGRFSSESLRENIVLAHSDLQDCCGVRVIHDLQRYEDAVVRFNRMAAVEYLDRETNRFQEEALAVIALSEEQLKVWPSLLEEAGFKMISKGHNTKTSNAIFLFVKVIHKTNKAYKKSQVKKPKSKAKRKAS